MMEWQRRLPVFRAVLLAGKTLGIHCMGGRGRSGTVATMLLIELGLTPAKAILAVRAARPRAIGNSEQERFVQAYRRGPDWSILNKYMEKAIEDETRQVLA